jgi:hypothetical protein
MKVTIWCSSELMRYCYLALETVLRLSRATGFVYMVNVKNWDRRCAHCTSKGPRVGLQSLESVGGVGEASPQPACLFNRQKLTAEIAHSSNLIKALIIKAEDARIVGDLKLMKRYYADLFAVVGITPSCPTTTRSC